MAIEYIEREALEVSLNHRLNFLMAENGEYDHYTSGFDEAVTRVEDFPAADVAPVRHGRWAHTKKHLWYKNKDGSVDEWRLDVGFHNGPECQVCGKAVCMHCHPDWESMECGTGHYLCSVCGEVSIDAHENYCPNCGAKMDGEGHNERERLDGKENT